MAVFACLGACTQVPNFGAAPSPEGVAAPVYRDLGAIPERPAPTDEAQRQQAVQSLTEDRARTAQAGESLRREPVIVPEPPQ